MTESIGTATYSPDDNKIRIYPDYRLDKDLYNRVRAAGFKWAPKQELFVAPMWTPGREDLALELCLEIGDEDTSLVDRAEERSERFEEYSEKRHKEADQAHAGVKGICDNIPFGQPILVGHHSEKRARKDAERIDNGMRKAIKLFETSEYWTRRAAGALSHAKYKERPDVRARRIKKIEADKRKAERNMQQAEKFLTMWQSDILDYEKAILISNYDHFSMCFTLEKYPRNPPASQYEGSMGIWSALTENIITFEQARDIVIPVKQNTVNRCQRWIEHYKNRLIYERTLLEAQGGADLLKPKPKSAKAALPLCNYRAPEGVKVENPYHRGEFSVYPQVEMSKAEYSRIYKDYKGTRPVENSHRIRTAMIDRALCCIFLTDSKEHKKPEAVTVEPKPQAPIKETRAPRQKTEAETKADLLREQIKTGFKVVTADQLFVTPSGIADNMVKSLCMEPGLTVLEPNGGTGALIKAVLDQFDTEVVSYEINSELVDNLRRDFPSYKLQVRCADFLTVKDGPYSRIIMNPPFKNGDDIRHIKHALSMLRPGGRLVALCADGPRQNDQLKPLCSQWEPLPSNSFKSEGTGVNVVQLVIEKAEV